MSTRKFLISIVLVVAMLIVLGTTSVKAVDFRLQVNYDGADFEIDVTLIPCIKGINCL